MNRILFEPSENRGGEVRLAGPRAHHVWAVLQAQPGDAIRAGEVGGDRYDGARVVVSTPSECILRLGEASPPLLRAAWDLLLALPRPKCLRRLWPQIAALGPERVYLTAAEKVEKDYWGCTLLRPDVYRPLLIDGLAQSGDTILPEVEVHRRLKPLVEDVLPRRYAEGRRLVAHPPRAGARNAAPDKPPAYGAGIVAVGPEGGWSDYELRMFEAAGFRRVSLGPRVLRTDTAVVALLSLLTLPPPR